MSDSDNDDDIFGLRNGSRSTIVHATGPNWESTMSMNFNDASAVGSVIAGNLHGHQRFRQAARGVFAPREASPVSMRSTQSYQRPPEPLRSFRHPGFAQSSMINGCSRAMSPGSESVRSFGSNAAGSVIAGNFHGHQRFRQAARREASLVSVHSARSYQQIPEPQQCFRHPGFAQSSMVNGYSRAKSPGSESVRSFASNVTATDIIVSKLKIIHEELKINKFDKSEMRRINHVVKNLTRIEKRRKRKRVIKEARRRSGDDSRELTSDSSLSDECGSIRTSFTQNNNYSRYAESFKKRGLCGRSSEEALSTKSCFTDIRKNVQGNTLYKDCSNSFRNILSLPTKSRKSTAVKGTYKTDIHSETMNRTTLQERFKSSFMIPSQRFPKSSTIMPIQEGSEHPEKRHIFPNSRFKTVSRTNIQKNNGTDSEEDNSQPRDEIIRDQPETQGKRNLNISDYSPNCSKSKKAKLSPIPKSKEPANHQRSGENDFVFTKPGLPMRRQNPKQKGKPAHQSKQPSKPKTNPPLNLETNSNADNVKEATNCDEHSETLQSCASDVPARPSFIKRKLFTQTLDVTESKNTDQDSSPSVSPQSNVYSAINNEKTKARKLVSNQSCLSRDVHNEDNNFIDLIHKLVPPDRMNSQKNETCPNSNDTGYNSNRLTQESRWDVTSLLSQCDDDKISETYTDEEIFVVCSEDKSKNKSVQTKTANSDKKSKEKSRESKTEIEKKKNEAKQPKTPVKEVHQEVNSDVYSWAQNFWNCSSESDDLDTCVANTIDETELTTSKTKSEKVAAEKDQPKHKEITAKGKIVLDDSINTESDISRNAPNIRRGRPRKELVETDVSENTLDTTDREKPTNRAAAANSSTNADEYCIMTRKRSRLNSTNSPALIATKNNIASKVFKSSDKMRGRVLVTPKNKKANTTKRNKNNASSRPNVKSPRSKQVVPRTSQGDKKVQPKSAATDNDASSRPKVQSPKSKQVAQSTSQGDKRVQSKSAATDNNPSSGPKVKSPKSRQVVQSGSQGDNKKVQPKSAVTDNDASSRPKVQSPSTQVAQSASQGDTKVQSKGAARDTSAAAQRNKATSKPTNQKRRDANKENIEIDSSLNNSVKTRATTRKLNNAKPDSPSSHGDNKTNNNASAREARRLGRRGLGFASATIGVAPAHCGAPPARTDEAGVLSRSTVMTRSMTTPGPTTGRSRRPKFLQVY